MSAFSSIFPNIRRSQASAMQSQPDPLSELRFALEVMPGSRKYVFTPGTRAEILAKLYSSFLGNYPQLFLPASAGGSNGVAKIPQHMLLSEFQMSHSASSGLEDAIPGRPCAHLFQRGECCFRCKCVFCLYISISTLC